MFNLTWEVDLCLIKEVVFIFVVWRGFLFIITKRDPNICFLFDDIALDIIFVS